MIAGDKLAVAEEVDAMLGVAPMDFNFGLSPFASGLRGEGLGTKAELPHRPPIPTLEWENEERRQNETPTAPSSGHCLPFQQDFQMRGNALRQPLQVVAPFQETHHPALSVGLGHF